MRLIIMKKGESESTGFISYEYALKILTPREIEVLDLIEKGYLNKEIAEEMNISIRTVHAHRRNICYKLELKGTGALPKWLWITRNSDSDK